MRLPSGTVTFLFSDIVGSAQLWERDPEGTRNQVSLYTDLAESAITRFNGILIQGEGEIGGLYAVYTRVSDALAAAAALERACLAELRSGQMTLQIHMALHTTETVPHSRGYDEGALQRCRQLCAVAHRGQILVSQATAQAAQGLALEGMS